jgi:phage/conjugal plasmid C-4 type zinc finger TraR family protein
MMDEADRAQNFIDLDLENAIKAARGVMPSDTKSADCCVECGCEIPSVRQAALPGVQTCFDCAAVLESKRLRGLL